MDKTDRKLIIISSFVIFFIAVIVQVNTLANGFVYDDAKQILSNIWITDTKYLADIFTNDVWGFWPERDSSAYYRPLMHIINLAVYQTAGLEPWAYHLVNVLFHAGNSFLVFLLAMYLFRNKDQNYAFTISFAAALLFAVHPIHTESVAWIGGITDLSFSFFFLLSFYFYLRAKEKSNPSFSYLSASLFSFALSLLAKEPALVLPLVLILHDYSGQKTSRHRKFWIYIPYLVLAAGYLAVRSAIVGPIVGSLKENPAILTWLPDVFVLFSRYLWKLILPVNLNAYYSYSPAGSFIQSSVLTGIAIAFVFIAALFISFRRSRLIFTCLLLIGIPLLPALYIPAIGGTSFAERYLYLPSVGFVILFSWALFHLAYKFKSHAKSIPVIAGIIVFMLYTAGSFFRNQIWQSDYTLWKDTASKTPNSSIVRNNLGLAYFKRGEIDKAIQEFDEALKLKKGHAEAHNNLGAAYAMEGQSKKAEQHFLAALRLKPDYSDAHNNLGIFYGSQGKMDQAIMHFQQALRSRPNFADAHYNLGVTYLRIGSTDLALQQLQEALKIKPNAINTHVNIAKAYAQKGLINKSQEHMRIARKLAASSQNK